MTAARLAWLCKWGVDFRARKGEICCVDALDAQRERGKSIFGDGLLLSDTKAAENAAAGNEAAKKGAMAKWLLSEREWALVRSLG